MGELEGKQTAYFRCHISLGNRKKLAVVCGLDFKQ